MKKNQPEKPTEKVAGHGGKREGAGRKPVNEKPKVPISARVSPEVKEYLDKTGNRSEAIELAVRKLVGFQAWERGRSKQF